MRSTLDIDILADVQLEHIPLLLDALKPDFYADDLMIMERGDKSKQLQLDPL